MAEAPRDHRVIIGTALTADGQAVEMPMIWSSAHAKWLPVSVTNIEPGLQPDGWRPPADHEI
jgi:hypothetical protein